MTYQFFILIILFLISLGTNSYAIVNGHVIENSDRPEVAKLILIKSGYEQGICSGVAISDFLVLTAGHCINPKINQKNDAIALHRTNNGKDELILANKVYTEYIAEDFYEFKKEQNKNSPVPGCSPGAKPLYKSKTPDLALLRFPINTFKTWAQVSFAEEFKNDDLIEFLGFGVHRSSFIDSASSFGSEINKLRIGYNFVWRSSEQRIAMISQTDEPIADTGDSGGPVFRNGQVAGIISTIEEKCETTYGEDYAIMNTITVLSSAEAVNFFSRAVDKILK